MMDIDGVLFQVGGYKRWNLFMCTLVGMAAAIPLAWQGPSIVFVGWEPPHTCARSESPSITHLAPYQSNLNERNQSHLDPKCYFENYDYETGDVSVMKCNNWTFEDDGYHTIVEEWDLVCDRNYMAELSQILYHVGEIVGDVFSFVVDKYGRKKLHIISHLCLCIIGVFNAYSVNYVMFALSKSALGLFAAINITSGTMLVLEFFDAKRRTLIGMGFQIFWAISYTMLPGLAYLIKGWNFLQMTISLASLVLALLIIPIPESPSWLISRDKIEEADKILRNVAKWNRVKLDQKAEILVQQTLKHQSYKTHGRTQFTSNVTKHENGAAESRTDEEIISETNPPDGDQNKSNRFKSLGNPIILKNLVISSLLWFSNCLIFYGLILASPSLEGNRFLNFVLLGLVEFPVAFLAYFSTKNLGRRLTCSSCSFLTGCFIAVIIFIPKVSWVYLAFVIVSKAFISASFAIMVLYTKELFPTNIRGTSAGIYQLFGGVGSLSAPMTAYMAKSERLFWVPYILFGVVSIVVSFLLLFLPETNNQPLPETLQDCHRLNKNKFFKCQRKR